MTSFQVGKTYFQRMICDSDQIVQITVERRTAKTIWTTCGKKLRISEWQGNEQVKPDGSYSMCTIIGSDRELEAAA